ncbi:hypothetical protein ACHAWF_016245, partial [Thalassiosira exigua]
RPERPAKYDVLEGLLRDNSFLISSQGETVSVTKKDPVAPVEVLHNNIQNKLRNKEADVKRFASAVAEVQRKVSEKQIKLGHLRQRQQELEQKQQYLLRDGGAVQKVKNVIKALIRYNRDHIDPEKINENTSTKELLHYINERIKENSEEEERPEHITRVIKRLKKIAKKTGSQGEAYCPCCQRDFTGFEDYQKFMTLMSELTDPEVSLLHELANQNARECHEAVESHEKWRATITENTEGYLEFACVIEEMKVVEADVAEADGDGLKQLEEEVKTAEANLTDGKESVKDLQNLLSAVNGMQVTAKRVWEKMISVKERKDRLKYDFMGNVDDPRDLKTVEKDLAKSSDQKEEAYNNINKLNNEQKQLVKRKKISRVANQAATAEQNAREKEDAFKRDQESTKRKEELNEQLKRHTEIDNELDREMLPIRTQLLQKESDRDRRRDHNAHTDKVLSDKVQAFERDIDKLKDLNDKIDQYVASNKENQIAEVDQKLLHNIEDIRDGESQLNDMKPELENLKKQVEDGERQKKILQDNLDLLKLSKKVDQLQDEVNTFQDEIDGMGGDEAQEQYDSAKANAQQQQSKIERHNGRMSGLNDQKRALRRKLNEPEYKGVDERQREKMIEFETTSIVVSDLDKYYDALDKALLRYHGMKIADINKIIRELWTLCYKGEDITNIEIQSGQDSGSRANRSYNYRIVMSKGSTQMDMRGRCSAGQRVLASIVIRLALAETFCLNCGVMALDEPTTNLDYENKRGLGVALAQIIASRAAQSNFQLVVITRDKEFVSMMKQELSSQTGFNMPERYYQVSREEGHDGRFYSRITAIDWDDL